MPLHRALVRGLATAATATVATAGLAFLTPVVANADTPETGPLTLDISTSCPDMQIGSRGECVRALQGELDYLGAAIDADGKYGPETAGAVRRIQQEYSFQYVDGIAGPESRQKIQSHYDEKRRLVDYNPNAVSDSLCSNLGNVPFVGNSLADGCKSVFSTDAAG